ncbi:sorting nexin-41 [[Candida] anglica]|uniref:Sorting nexin-41 n=1 Tax=[Candida] anglica TaxID=148631 RepID=A0ABP0E9P9_9ASCO
MDPNDHSNPFGDIEPDNNPSFYGNPSVINDPYGKLNNELSNNDSIAISGEYHTDEDEIVDVQNIPQTSNERPIKHKHSHSNNGGGLNINDSLVMSNKISQIIHNKSSLKIDVTSTERLMNSTVIVYCIHLSLEGESGDSDIVVKRRYSEFKSLRDNLMRLFPTLIIPPIPQKHSLFTYLMSTINNSEEMSIIQTRRRLFSSFLNDLVFNSNERISNCRLLHKFLDPNYEMCWDNAIHEPPISLVPDHLLLANPIDPTNQNGLYSLLPNINGGYDSSGVPSGTTDNLGPLKKYNEDLHKLKEQIHVLELKQSKQGDLLESGKTNTESLLLTTSKFSEIPIDLMKFETNFFHSIKISNDLDKLNTRTGKNLKSLIGTLIELGSNLNNFSLQVHSPEQNGTELTLASQIEKFGSTIDSVFLNYESYIMNSFVPKWQEPIHQLIQHYLTAVQLLRFYKLKLIQYKLLYKSRIRKSQELESFTINLDSQQQINEALKNGLELNSPSITEAVRKFESKQRKYKNSLSGSHKKSWYGLFGGKSTSSANYESFKRSNEALSSPGRGEGVNNPLEASEEISNAHQYQFKNKIEQIEREIVKLDQLIDLTNVDMVDLTKELEVNFEDFMRLLEKRWLVVMIDFIRGGKKLFEENLGSWQNMKDSIS